MEPTILIDGRCILAEPCVTLSSALMGFGNHEQWLFEEKGKWYIACCCCEGGGEHVWSPSGYGVDPNGGHYTCGPCAGAGRFNIKMP